jgi:hypothetical protein
MELEAYSSSKSLESSSPRTSFTWRTLEALIFNVRLLELAPNLISAKYI